MSSSPSPDAEPQLEAETAETVSTESAAEPSAPTDVADTDVADTTDASSDESAGSSTNQSPPPSEKTETASADSAVVAETVVAETVVAETVAAETDSSETDSSGDDSGMPSDKPRRQLRLNPTANPDQLKAVPSLPPGGTSAETPTGEEASADAAVEVSRRAMPPVELPADDENLDAEMEAEITAALSSGELKTTVSDLPSSTITDGTKGTDGTTGTDGTKDAEGGEEPRTLDEGALEEGTKLTGRIESIHGDDVFLDLGFRSPGMVPHRQFEAAHKPRVGQLIEVVIGRVDQEQGLIQLNLPRGVRRVGGNWDAVSPGQVVDCVVSRANKGGLEVSIGTLRGFLPAGQVDLYYISDLEPYVGQKLRVQVLKSNEKKRDLIVSRRAYLEVERKQAAEELWKTLAEGQVFTGTIKTLKDYGAFVDLGGVDGFLHISQIGWSRIHRPADVLTVGQQVEVKVLSIDTEKQRISLGMRQLIADPWSTAVEDFAKGTTISGMVTRTTDFGAFVELTPGVEGLVHISELDHARVRKVSDVLKNGQEIEVQVLEVDLERKRISLSLKALSAKPDEPKDEAPPTVPYQRKRTEPLKGGTSSSSGGGLFGNPGDFGS